jgi:prophage tail gpP-like protein
MSLVTVLANGIPLSGWLEVHVDQAHDKVSGQAMIKMSAQPGIVLPMHVGDSAIVLIDGQPVLTGHVHEVFGDLDISHHHNNVVCRDNTQDFIDSTVGPGLKIQPPVTLQQLITQTLGVMGLSHIGVIDNIRPDPYQQGEQVSASIDDRGFSFIDAWAQKRQVLLHTDGKGNIVIDRNQRLRGAGYLLSTYGDDPLNNVQRSQYRNSDLNRHNLVAVNGQKSTNDKNWWESKSKGEPTAQADPLQKNWGTASCTDVRGERRLHCRGSKGFLEVHRINRPVGALTRPKHGASNT